MSESLRCDAVVVGSGAGGAPVAMALAAAGLDVVVLEAGARFETRDFSGEEGEMIARLMTANTARDSGMEVYAGACVGGRCQDINRCVLGACPAGLECAGSIFCLTVITGELSSNAFLALNDIQMPSRCQMRPPATKRLMRGRSCICLMTARSTRWKKVIGRSSGRPSFRPSRKSSAGSASRSCG